MLDYVYGYDEIVSKFVASLIPSCRERGFPDNARTIGIIDNEGKLFAGLVYYNYNPDAGIIEMSAASLPGRNCMTRETLKRAYQYPFHTCKCQMIYTIVPDDDTRLLRQLAALNFVFVRVPRLLGRNEDAVVCTLTDDDWANNKVCRRFKHHIPDAEPLEEAA